MEAEVFPYSKAAKERRIRHLKRLIPSLKEVISEQEKELEFLLQDKPVRVRKERTNKYTKMLRR